MHSSCSPFREHLLCSRLCAGPWMPLGKVRGEGRVLWNPLQESGALFRRDVPGCERSSRHGFKQKGLKCRNGGMRRANAFLFMNHTNVFQLLQAGGHGFMIYIKSVVIFGGVPFFVAIMNFFFFIMMPESWH